MRINRFRAPIIELRLSLACSERSTRLHEAASVRPSLARDARSTSLRVAASALALLSLAFAVIASTLSAPAWAARPDPSVGLEIKAPTDKAHCLPGERIEIEVQLTDPLQLVRNVFVRIAAPNNRILNGDQTASLPSGGRAPAGQPETWRKTFEVPVSAVAGRYVIQVEALGDGNTPLQWSTVAFEVSTAAFGARIVSPVENVVVSRNDHLDATLQLDDPRRKARRVFVTLEDPRTKQVLNGDREAVRRGALWIRDIHVPATLTPGVYRLVFLVYGEGREVLTTQSRVVTVSVAPVRLGDMAILPSGGIRPGQTVTLQAPLSDPRGIVRHVWVTIEGPNGRPIVRNSVARKSGDAFTYELNLDDDAALGTYTVEMQAIAQAGEVVASRRLTFPVRGR